MSNKKTKPAPSNVIAFPKASRKAPVQIHPVEPGAFAGIASALGAFGQHHFGWSDEHAQWVTKAVLIVLETGVKHG